MKYKCNGEMKLATFNIYCAVRIRMTIFIEIIFDINGYFWSAQG